MEENRSENFGSNAICVGPGPIRNGSAAERHLYFDIDIAHSRRHNQGRKETCNAIAGMIIIGLVLIAGACYLFLASSAWVTVLGAMTASLGLALLGIGGYAATQNAPQGYLDRGVLNPAIVCAAEKGQVVLLTLAEIGLYDSVWAIGITKVADLPGHRNVVGERIPVTCCFTGRDGERYKGVCVSPIAWGTRSAEVLQTAVEGIGEAEWQALERLRGRVVLGADYAVMGAREIQVLNQADVERWGLT